MSESKEDTITFSTLQNDGVEVFNRKLKRESILACPFTIFVPEHYRDDESCRCNDPDHWEMVGWGYTWGLDRWEAVDEEEGL